MDRHSDLEAINAAANPRTIPDEQSRAPVHDMTLGDLARGVGAISANRNAPVNQRLILQLQRRIGNRAVQRLLGLQRSATSDDTVDASVEQGISSARGGGHPLDRSLRPQMEAAFGADFSGVRIHTGAHADAMNRKVSAVAFTTGSDIFFSNGAYNPGTTEGQGLLAHELTHVVQQEGAQQPGVSTKLTLGSPDDAYEQEAERTAETVVKRLAAGTISRKCADCENEEQKKTAPGGVQTSVIRRKMINRAGEGGNPWFECRAQGVPCPPGSWFNNQMCKMIGCYRAKTSTLPFAVSPGVCIFRCPDGSLCTCVLVGTSSEAVCTFRFCDSAANADTQSDIDNLGMAALDAYQQQAPAADPSQAPGADPSQAPAQQPEEATV